MSHRTCNFSSWISSKKKSAGLKYRQTSPEAQETLQTNSPKISLGQHAAQACLLSKRDGKCLLQRESPGPELVTCAGSS